MWNNFPVVICRSIWKQTRASVQDKFGDVHTRLMKKNYDPVPQWWFYSILIIVVALSLLACEGFGRQLQLPYWGVLLAISLALVFTLPIGVITATTNQVYFKSSNLQFCLSTNAYLLKYVKYLCAATRAECHYRTYYWLHVSWQTSCQCGFQNLWLHKYVTSDYVPR